jgi:quinol monooxygenase YgiN
MSIVVVATILPLPEHREAVVEAFVRAIPKVHTEPGCELYALTEGEDRLVMVEKWSSVEALAVHDKGEALAELGKVLAGKLAGQLDIQVLQPHPAGTDKGTV